MNDIAHFRKLFCELDLVVIQKIGIGNDDDRYGDAECVEDCSGA